MKERGLLAPRHPIPRPGPITCCRPDSAQLSPDPAHHRLVFFFFSPQPNELHVEQARLYERPCPTSRPSSRIRSFCTSPDPPPGYVTATDPVLDTQCPTEKGPVKRTDGPHNIMIQEVSSCPCWYEEFRDAAFAPCPHSTCHLLATPSHRHPPPQRMPSRTPTTVTNSFTYLFPSFPFRNRKRRKRNKSHRQSHERIPRTLQQSTHVDDVAGSI